MGVESRFIGLLLLSVRGQRGLYRDRASPTRIHHVGPISSLLPAPNKWAPWGLAKWLQGPFEAADALAHTGCRGVLGTLGSLYMSSYRQDAQEPRGPGGACPRKLRCVQDRGSILPHPYILCGAPDQYSANLLDTSCPQASNSHPLQLNPASSSSLVLCLVFPSGSIVCQDPSHKLGVTFSFAHPLPPISSMPLTECCEFCEFSG